MSSNQETTAEILKVIGNHSVVKLPSRQFPSITLKGDTFHVLISTIRYAIDRFDTDAEEAISTLESLSEELKSVLSEYEQALVQHGFELPYRK